MLVGAKDGSWGQATTNRCYLLAAPRHLDPHPCKKQRSQGRSLWQQRRPVLLGQRRNDLHQLGGAVQAVLQVHLFDAAGGGWWGWCVERGVGWINAV